MNAVEAADKNFRSGCNCCQAVVMAYADELGLDRKTTMRLASNFGAGYGKLRSVCGAVSGMTIVAGLAKGYDDTEDKEGKALSYALERKIVEEFKKRNETIMCFELLGIKEGEDLPEPAVRDENYYESSPCEGLVKDAAEILEQEIFCRSDENKK